MSAHFYVSLNLSKSNMINCRLTKAQKQQLFLCLYILITCKSSYTMSYVSQTTRFKLLSNEFTIKAMKITHCGVELLLRSKLLVSLSNFFNWSIVLHSQHCINPIRNTSISLHRCSNGVILCVWVNHQTNSANYRRNEKEEKSEEWRRAGRIAPRRRESGEQSRLWEPIKSTRLTLPPAEEVAEALMSIPFFWFFSFFFSNILRWLVWVKLKRGRELKGTSGGIRILYFCTEWNSSRQWMTVSGLKTIVSPILKGWPHFPLGVRSPILRERHMLNFYWILTDVRIKRKTWEISKN